LSGPLNLLEMTLIPISLSAENSFTDPVGCPRDSLLVTLNPTGGTGVGTVTTQIRDCSDSNNLGVWEDWDRRDVAYH